MVRCVRSHAGRQSQASRGVAELDGHDAEEHTLLVGAEDRDEVDRCAARITPMVEIKMAGIADDNRTLIELLSGCFYRL